MEREAVVSGVRLRIAREAAGLTQGQLELKSGISQSLISKLENGARTNAKLSSLSQLACALGVSVNDLIVRPQAEAETAMVDELAAAVQQAMSLSDDAQRWLAELLRVAIVRERQQRAEREALEQESTEAPLGIIPPHGADDSDLTEDEWQRRNRSAERASRQQERGERNIRDQRGEENVR